MKTEYIPFMHSFFKHTFLAIVCLAALGENAFARTYIASDYISAWKAEKGSATIAILFEDLRKNDSIRFHKIEKEIEKYISLNPREEKVRIYFFIYQVMYQMVLEKVDYATVLPQIRKKMKQAALLQDKVLNSYLYAQYGELCLRNNKLETAVFYNLKALNIQESYGNEVFPYILNLYFSAARSMHDIQQYEKVIEFTQKYLKGIDKNTNMNSCDKIFGYDLLSSAYFETGKYRAAWREYEKMDSLLTRHPNKDEHWNNLWKGLVKGYKGRVFLVNKEYEKALAYLEQAIRAMEEYPMPEDAASFGIDKGAVYLGVSRLKEAEKTLLNTYTIISKEPYNFKIKLRLTDLLIQLYERTNDYKKVAAFKDARANYQQQMDKMLWENKLERIQAQIDYENLQEESSQVKKALKQEKFIRILVLAGVLLIILFFLILIRERRKKYRLKLQVHKEKEEKTAQELLAAKKQLDNFRDQVIQKNTVIDNLEKAGGETQPYANAIADLKKSCILTEEDWKEFQVNFEKVFAGYIYRLKNAYPSITPAEIRMIALSKIKFSHKEMAEILGISAQTTRITWHRLRKKINITEEVSLIEFAESI